MTLLLSTQMRMMSQLRSLLPPHQQTVCVALVKIPPPHIPVGVYPSRIPILTECFFDSHVSVMVMFLGSYEYWSVDELRIHGGIRPGNGNPVLSNTSLRQRYNGSDCAFGSPRLLGTMALRSRATSSHEGDLTNGALLQLRVR